MGQRGFFGNDASVECIQKVGITLNFNVDAF